MSEIWHRYDEAPKHQDIIMTDTGYWAYRADLLALETELSKTKQALDLALDTLKYANNCIKGGCVNWKTEIDKAIDRIIKQITESPAENVQTDTKSRPVNVQTTYITDGTTRTFYGRKCKVEFDVPPETQTHITITETKEVK